jgi:hypothetical protein
VAGWLGHNARGIPLSGPQSPTVSRADLLQRLHGATLGMLDSKKLHSALRCVEVLCAPVRMAAFTRQTPKRSRLAPSGTFERSHLRRQGDREGGGGAWAKHGHKTVRQCWRFHNCARFIVSQPRLPWSRRWTATPVQGVLLAAPLPASQANPNARQKPLLATNRSRRTA